MATIHDEALAQEIREREPWAIVVEHEPLNGGASIYGQSLMRVPEKPWKSADSSKWVKVREGRWVYRGKNAG